MITEDQVVDAYRKMIQLRVREVEIDNTGLEETFEQRTERLDAIFDADTLRLQYLAQARASRTLHDAIIQSGDIDFMEDALKRRQRI